MCVYDLLLYVCMYVCMHNIIDVCVRVCCVCVLSGRSDGPDGWSQDPRTVQWTDGRTETKETKGNLNLIMDHSHHSPSSSFFNFFSCHRSMQTAINFNGQVREWDAV